MLSNEYLSVVIDSQKGASLSQNPGIQRDGLNGVESFNSSGLFVLGVRGAGKSTYVRQLLSGRFPDPILLNMEDPRLSGFDTKDFSRLDSLLFGRANESLAFDEIQAIDNWEEYIHLRQSEARNIVVVASIASIKYNGFSNGFQVREVFPFSFGEFLKVIHQDPSAETIEKYLKIGGFPEYVKSRNEEVLLRLFDDIIYREIVVRQGIKQHDVFRQLAIHLIGNFSRYYSLNNLKNLFGIGSVRSVADYIAYLEDSYLIYSVPKYSESIKKQIANPRKIYCVDTGLARVTSVSLQQGNDQLLENMVYMHLRREGNPVYYYSGLFECDFIVTNNNRPVSAIQVCYDLNQNNLVKELKGVELAMKELNLDEGTIVTLDQEETFELKNRQIRAIPAWKFLMEPI
jgi:predicted AAA+ superfamily ATPase